MGSDGMGAMALLTGLVMLGLPVGGWVLFFYLGQAVSRRRAVSLDTVRTIGMIAGVAGGIVGALTMIAIFQPDVWLPKPKIRLQLEQGSDPDWVVLLESPVDGRTLRWTGRQMPFRGIRTTIEVPRSGIVRVRSLDAIEPGARIIWPDGSRAAGSHRGPAPPGIGARVFAAWTRHAVTDAADDIPIDDQALLTWLR